MTRIALDPVTAVTCDDHFQVVEQAAIHVEDGRLTYVGPAAEAPSFEADRTLGGDHLVAIPGLVNTHTHAAMTLLRGYADDMVLERWLEDRIWPFESGLESDDIYWATRLAIAEMIRNGVTCFADMYFHYRRGTEAMVETGVRACPSANVIGVFPDTPGQVAEARSFVKEWTEEEHPRIHPLLAPHSLYTCGPDEWKPLVEAAGEFDVPLHTHVAETRAEVGEVRKQWGATPVRALEKVGALEVPLIAAHCVHLDEDEMELVARRRNGYSTVRVAHNPSSNCKLASGVAPIPELLERGVDVGLATDGPASNNRLDVWSEMRLTAMIHKTASADPTVAGAPDVLRMATLGGARALGLDDRIGSLEEGKRADVVLVDFDRPHLVPRHNVISHLVYAAEAADVTAVLVEGRVLYEGGEYLTVDVERAQAEGEARARRLARRAEG